MSNSESPGHLRVSGNAIRRSLLLVCLFLFAVVGLGYLLIERPPEHYFVLIKGDPPVVTFYEIGVHKTTRLRGIEFYETRAPNGGLAAIWSLHPRTQAVKGESIQKLAYGHTPDGWIESQPAAPISMLHDHRIVLQTSTGIFNIDFPRRNDWTTRGFCTRK